MPGKLFVFEGIDGSGKTTQAEMLRKHLEELHIPVALFREPGGTPLGEEIRSQLLAHRSEGMSMISELLLYLAARAELIHREVRPRLEKGETVILDRYYYSTAAYQGEGSGLGSTGVLKICNQLKFPEPEFVFLLDLDPETAFQRVNRGKDRIESRSLNYFRLVRDTFLDMAKRNPNHHVLNATDPADALHNQVVTVITKTPNWSILEGI